MIPIMTSALLVVLAAAPSVVSLPLGPLDLLGPSDPLSPLDALGRPGPLVLNSPLRAQYHAQDELGQYSYGYSGGPSAKHEERSADGVVRGSFAYVDPNGKVQTRSYVADDLNGFRVVASDVPQQPQPMPGYAAAAAPAPAPAPAGWFNPQRDPHWISRWSLEQSPYEHQLQHLPILQGAQGMPQLAVRSAFGDGFIVPSPVQPQLGPLGPLGVIRSQYHAQDEAGQYTYGYSNENSSKSETKTADGVTRGSYSYVDPSGLLQTRSYVADADGFRVAASDLP